MKLSKFMCAAFAAAMVLAGCNKENETPVDDGSNGFKSCVLQLENVALTKLPSTDYISNNTSVTLNSFQVFFSDGTNIYQAYESDGVAVADTYFDSDTDDLAAMKQFHFLPHAVNEVLVIGNFDEITNLGTVDETGKYSLTRQQLREQINQLEIATQQNPSKMKLFGVDQSLVAAGNHDTASDKNPVYMAEVELKPTVARFEITGFNYDVDPGATARKYTSLSIKQLTVRSYFEKATAAVSGESVLTVTGSQNDAYNESTYPITEGNVNAYFNAVKGKGWFADEPNITFADPTWSQGNLNPTTDAPYTAESDENVLYSYQLFPGQVPQFLVRLEAQPVSGATEHLYLMTNSLRKSATEILLPQDILPGNIYRMAFTFSDGSFEQPEKCIELTVSVAKWQVNVLTPEF